MSESKITPDGPEITVHKHPVTSLTKLRFGAGNVGTGHHLEGERQERLLEALGRFTYRAPSGVWLPIDCMDDRPLTGLGDGTKDPEVLAARQAFQLPGGGVLAATKALVAADATILRGEKSMKSAFRKMYGVFKELGIPDGAHAGCGASIHCEGSIAHPIDAEMLTDTFVSLGAERAEISPQLADLKINKTQRLQAGFYADWDPEWHRAYTLEQDPANFAYLQEKLDDVHGHYGAGAYLVPKGSYFAKNHFVAETGEMRFALTFGAADALARIFSGTEQERQRISLAFRDDAFNVTNRIVAVGLEIDA